MYIGDIKFGKTSKVLIKVAAISTATLAIIGVWTFYKNNFWSPKIEVKDVDFKKGISHLIVNGKPFTLKGDSIYSVGANYGIKFGYTYSEDGKRVYDRIEVLKNGLVHSIKKEADTIEMKSFTANENTYYDNTFNGFVGTPKSIDKW